MSRRQASKIRAAFRTWDLDGNGMISREELTTLMAQLGTFSEAGIEVLMIEADRNRDGVIDYSEFVDWVTKPGQVLGAAALLSQAELNLRADTVGCSAAARGQSPSEVGGVPAWTFGQSGPGPLRFNEARLLAQEFTIAVWALLEESAGTEWVPLVGDEIWGLCIGLSPSGALGVRDPRVLPGKHLEAPVEPLGSWVLVIACSSADAVGDPRGSTEFFVASDERAVRSLGTVDAAGSGLVISEVGGTLSGVSAVASVAVWPKLLEDEEMREVFLWDAQRMGCITAAQAERLKLGRRDAPARTEQEEATFCERLAQAEAGKAPGDTLNLASLCVVDADLPRVMRALAAAFDGVTCLVLSHNYITEEGVVEHLAPFLRSLASPFRLSLVGNSDVTSVAEPALLSALPFHTGSSVDVTGTRLSESAREKLLNNTDEAAQALQEAAQERRRSAEACAAFDSQQDQLRSRWSEECDEAPDPPSESEDEELARPPRPEAEILRSINEAVEALRNLPKKALIMDAKSNAKPPHAMLEAMLAAACLLEQEKRPDAETAKALLHDANLLRRIESFDREHVRSRSLRWLHTMLRSVDANAIASANPAAGHLLAWATAVEEFAQTQPREKEVDSKDAVEDTGALQGKFPLGNAAQLKLLRVRLTREGHRVYDTLGALGFSWQGPLPKNCGTGQLLAHFAYLCYSMELRKPQDFGLRLRRAGESPSGHRPGVVGLHAAIERDQVRIQAASGHSYGKGALRLTLSNSTRQPLSVLVPAGCIFEHIGWVHRQNLLVARGEVVSLAPGEKRNQQINAYCMNASCACSGGEAMFLTGLELDPSKQGVLRSQAMVWDHFEGIFKQYRGASGVEASGKKKRGKSGG